MIIANLALAMSVNYDRMLQTDAYPCDHKLQSQTFIVQVTDFFKYT